MNRQIYAEASEWLVELRVGDMDPAARERLDAWFRASPQHIRAFLELSNLWEEGSDPALDRTRSTEDLIQMARGATTNVVPLAAEFESTPVPSPPQEVNSTAPVAAQSSVPRHRTWPWAVAASFAVASILGLALYSRWHWTYSTGVGEQRTVALADGSTLELNARSRVRVRYSWAERDVELIAGQALFRVARDASRPFVVLSGGTRVRAVGTQFDVYRRNPGTTVTVLEGRVTVSAESHPDVASTPAGSASPFSVTAPAATAILVSAGEQVTVSPGQVAKPAHTDVAAATAWTQRELVFDSTPLADVAAEFNRYNEKPLVVADAQLRDFHVTGVFSSTNPASLLKFLRAQKDIQVVETDAAIRITKK